MFGLGPIEMVIVMGIAVMLFGKRLPEVGRSLGRGIIEFKKGLNGAIDDVDLTTGARHNGYRDPSWHSSESETTSESAYSSTSAPKFELPPAPSEKSPETAGQTVPRD